MSELLTGLDVEKLPKHIAIIMDGNGRWAKKQGAKRIFGHNHAIKAVRETTEACAEIGISFLTLYAFSTENWNRPQEEVFALMDLLVKTIKSEIKTLMDNNIRLQAIGDIVGLPQSCQDNLAWAIDHTRNNSRMTLNLALNYSGRWDIQNAVNQIALNIKSSALLPEKAAELFPTFLSTHFLPDPELLIRTSGEYRISNFLLWETAYTEFYFTDILWPDFRKKHLIEAIQDYQKRERRFGKTGDQIKSSIENAKSK